MTAAAAAHEFHALSSHERLVVVQARFEAAASMVARTGVTTSASRYLEAVLIPAAAAIWLHNALVLLNHLV